MKIIDCETKGNAIRLYLGKDNLKDWYGDDWNDRGCNDRVYKEYITQTADIIYDFKDTVYSIFNLIDEDKISKEMLKNRAYPLLIICHDTDKEKINDNYNGIWDYASAMEWKNKTVIYMGDEWHGKIEVK